MKTIFTLILTVAFITSYGQKCKLETNSGGVKTNKSVKLGGEKGFTVKLAITNKSGDISLNLELVRIASYFTCGEGIELIIELENGKEVILSSSTGEVGRKSGMNYSLVNNYAVSADDLALLKSSDIKKLTVHTDNGYFFVEGGKNAGIIISQLKCVE